MADDDEEDCLLARQALEASGAAATFSCVEDGTDLMRYLSERSASWPRGLPGLILLDLNMPRKDGREALLEIKAEPALRHIPIVILTTSEEERDIVFTRKAGADSFITKPATFGEWVGIMKSLAGRWLGGDAGPQGGGQDA
ncbi:MAG: response regulator [Thermodesulfobacteriota bacterium]